MRYFFWGLCLICLLHVNLVNADQPLYLPQSVKSNNVADLINDCDLQMRQNVQSVQTTSLHEIAKHKTKLRSLKTKKASEKEIDLLLKRIEKISNAYDNHKMYMEDNTFYEVMMSVYAFGRKKTVYSETSRRYNAIGVICYDKSLGGLNSMNFFRKLPNDSDDSDNMVKYYHSDRTEYNIPLSSSSKASVKTGYYLQMTPGEFLAILAVIRIPIDYDFEIDGNHFKVSDLVEDAKQYDIEGDMSYLLTGLSYYCQKISWKTRGGNNIKIEDILKHEIYRIKSMDSQDMTDCLYGIACARNSYLTSFTYSPKAYTAAKLYLDYYIEVAFQNQTSDFGWSEKYFYKNKDVADYVATVNMLSWLIISVPSDLLQDRIFVRAIERIVSELESCEKSMDLSQNSLNQTKTLFRALRVINLYKQRISNNS